MNSNLRKALRYGLVAAAASAFATPAAVTGEVPGWNDKTRTRINLISAIPAIIAANAHFRRDAMTLLQHIQVVARGQHSSSKSSRNTFQAIKLDKLCVWTCLGMATDSVACILHFWY